MRSPKIKVGAVFLLLLAAGCFLPRASAQMATPPIREDSERPIVEQRASKLDTFYKASRIYLWAGTTLDMTTTVRSLNHPPIAREAGGTFLMNYPSREAGWAGHIVGSRNTAAVVAANVGLDLGVDFLSRRLYRKGGRWRYLAVGLNLWKATDNTMAGFHNMGYTRSLDQRVRQATGYQGQITWTWH